MNDENADRLSYSQVTIIKESIIPMEPPGKGFMWSVSISKADPKHMDELAESVTSANGRRLNYDSAKRACKDTIRWWLMEEQ